MGKWPGPAAVPGPINIPGHIDALEMANAERINLRAN